MRFFGVFGLSGIVAGAGEEPRVDSCIDMRWIFFEVAGLRGIVTGAGNGLRAVDIETTLFGLFVNLVDDFFEVAGLRGIVIGAGDGLRDADIEATLFGLTFSTLCKFNGSNLAASCFGSP